MRYDDWYVNLPFYKKLNIQDEFNFNNWGILTESQKNNVYNAMLYELYIDGPVEFYQEEEWEE